MSEIERKREGEGARERARASERERERARAHVWETEREHARHMRECNVLSVIAMSKRRERYPSMIHVC